jgi:hypothetical protein
MKTIKTTLFLWVLCLFCGIAIFAVAGNKNSDNVSISVKESANEYNFKADYNRDKAAKVEQCLDDYLKGINDASFKHTEMDAEITLSDHTVFYVKSEPGELRIELDKRKNSREAVAKFRKLYEALKKALA